MPVSAAFDRLDIVTPSGNPGELAVTASAFEGKALVCAAIAVAGDAEANKAWNEAVLRAASIYINGDPIYTDLKFATVVSGTSDLTGVEATCITTVTPWKPDYTGSKARVAIGEIRL